TLCPCLADQPDNPEQNDRAEQRHEESEPPTATLDVDAEPVEYQAAGDAADDDVSQPAHCRRWSERKVVGCRYRVHRRSPAYRRPWPADRSATLEGIPRQLLLGQREQSRRPGA